MADYLPPGWQERLEPPRSEGWEATAVAWLLDLAPGVPPVRDRAQVPPSSLRTSSGITSREALRTERVRMYCGPCPGCPGLRLALTAAAGQICHISAIRPRERRSQISKVSKVSKISKISKQQNRVSTGPWAVKRCQLPNVQRQAMTAEAMRGRRPA